MHSLGLYCLRSFRFPKPKFTSTRQTHLKLHCVSAFIRHKADIALVHEGKSSEFGVMHSEVASLSWLHKAAPAFPINGSNVTIIYEPSDFYNTLLQKCKTAKRRITFASLYLGTGKLEIDLVNAINETINSSKGTVKVRILLDYMRGSRGQLNSRKMLEPLLVGTYGHCCQVFLYHTPKLYGFLKKIIPDRFNEIIGLQHMKLYMIDDTLIISGANLSNIYFTNRQDRYFVIENCKELCDFYDELVKRVGEFSFLLQSDGSTIFSSTMKHHPFKASRKEFTKEAASRVQTLLQSEIEKRKDLHKIEQDLAADTWVFPLLQMGQFNIQHDSEITLKLLKTAPAGVTIKLATGYFNLTSQYCNALLKHCQATCQLLTAHPTANGFFNAKGVASGIPAAYTRIAESFYKMCKRMGQEDRVTLWEFAKPGWTYHAKGLWYFLPGEQKPCLTLIGSPNFGYRSVKRDLETQIAIVTKNKNLQDAMYEEQERLFARAELITRKTFRQENRVPAAWVCAVVALFRYFF